MTCSLSLCPSVLKPLVEGRSTCDAKPLSSEETMAWVDVCLLVASPLYAPCVSFLLECYPQPSFLARHPLGTLKHKYIPSSLPSSACNRFVFFFSDCCDKILKKKQVKGGLIGDHNLRVQSMMAGKAWYQGYEETGHIAFIARKQKKNIRAQHDFFAKYMLNR